MARKPKSKTASSSEVSMPTGESSLAQNSIEEVLTPEKQPAKRPRPKADEAPARARAASTGSQPGPTRQDDARPLPDGIRERFIVVGNEFYFPDGKPAFEDHGKKLTTHSENTEVIRSMIQVAQTRGWKNVALNGTERFRKEAWFAASLAGIAIKGYEPTDFERAHMVRAIARRGQALQEMNGHRESDGGQRSATAPAARHAGERAEPEGAPVTGRLVDHGPAPYRHNPKEGMSYFVRLETPNGDREIWGVDLERAVNKSLTKPGLGDEVTLMAVGRDPVTVRVERRDEADRVVGADEVRTHRNRWVVERSDFLAQRAAAASVFRDTSVSAEEGAKRHPELTGTYLQLQIAKEGAKRDIAHPADQKMFIARTREALARAIEHGEPLEPVRMRERLPEQAPRAPTFLRDVEPER